MASKEKFYRCYTQGTTTYQVLLLQIVEKDGRRRNPNRQLVREMVLLAVVAAVFVLGIIWLEL